MSQLTVPVHIGIGQIRNFPAECVIDDEVFNSSRSRTHSMQVIRPISQPNWKFMQSVSGEWYGIRGMGDL